ncbi:bifunctional DedA family/phosphatase PAP2 family protein [Variovorax paradoxus]|uniref:Inner membrane protein YabI n=1 Tax=Variovorax paradoxus TaxID=34073 RepID=A0A0H2LUE9_VARPD|nr:bifunctional DedA family/phosphatase PAP2 family protein [Variovorax paradoxus]KLN52092.1 inner membrane protein YabI [Variovorax paradoxus]
MESHLQALIGYFSEHPQWALAAVFAAALLESLAVIGTVVPGSSIVFVGGVLVGLQALDPASVAIAAVCGAIAGDGTSYWLGRRHRDRIRALWPMKAYPALFDRGQAYFAKNGGKSVFLARFLGPLRAVVPVVAGMSGLPAPQFCVFNVLSALVWAAAHLAPGFLFGASLQLAGAVSSRLAVLLLFVAGALWLVVWLVALLHRQARPRIEGWRDRAVAWASTRSNLPARIVLSLFDPTRVESKALLAAALMLIGGAWLFFGVLEDVLSNDPLVQVDRRVYAMLQMLRTAWGDSLMVAVTELGSAPAVISVITAVSLWLAAKRCWRTLGYWLAAVGFAQLLVWTLKFTLGRARPTEIYSGIDPFSFPSGHAAMNIVVYGFLAFLLARAKPVGTKIAITLSAAMVILLIAFSRLYLGAHWFSDVLASLSLGLAWAALLSIAYLNHVGPEKVSALPLSMVVGLTLALVGGWVVVEDHRADLAQYAYRPRSDTVPVADWRADGWRRLASTRTDLGGDAEEPLSVQWAGPTEEVAGILNRAGWHAPPPWAAKTALLWLLPNTPIDQLAVLPKLDYGEAQGMTFIKVLNADERTVLRLWLSAYVVESTGAGPPHPLWIGMVTTERLRRPVGLITLAATQHDFTTPLRRLAQDVRAQQGSAQWQEWTGRVVLLIG